MKIGHHVLRVTVHRKRLIAALRAASRLSEDEPTQETLREQAELVVSDFAARWLEKKPCA
jgi:hypothetical protein